MKINKLIKIDGFSGRELIRESSFILIKKHGLNSMVDRCKKDKD